MCKEERTVLVCRIACHVLCDLRHDQCDRVSIIAGRALKDGFILLDAR